MLAGEPQYALAVAMGNQLGINILQTALLLQFGEQIQIVGEEDDVLTLIKQKTGKIEIVLTVDKADGAAKALVSMQAFHQHDAAVLIAF